MARDLFRSTSEFAATIDGAPVIVHRGDLVREGHPLLKGRKDLFVPYEPTVRFDLATPKAKAA